MSKNPASKSIPLLLSCTAPPKNCLTWLNSVFPLSSAAAKQSFSCPHVWRQLSDPGRMKSGTDEQLSARLGGLRNSALWRCPGNQFVQLCNYYTTTPTHKYTKNSQPFSFSSFHQAKRFLPECFSKKKRLTVLFFYGRFFHRSCCLLFRLSSSAVIHLPDRLSSLCFISQLSSSHPYLQRSLQGSLRRHYAIR